MWIWKPCNSWMMGEKLRKKRPVQIMIHRWVASLSFCKDIGAVVLTVDFTDYLHANLLEKFKILDSWVFGFTNLNLLPCLLTTTCIDLWNLIFEQITYSYGTNLKNIKNVIKYGSTHTFHLSVQEAGTDDTSLWVQGHTGQGSTMMVTSA